MTVWTFLKVFFGGILSAVVGFFLWKKRPTSPDGGNAPPKEERPDVVTETEKESQKIEEEKKEKDHEKTLSGIINDGGGFVNDQPVTIQRNGYFNLKGD
jgi:hypothetical protein